MFKKLFSILIIVFSISGWASPNILDDPQPGVSFSPESEADRMEDNSEVKERTKSNGNFKRIGRFPDGVLFAKTTSIGKFKGGLFIYNGKIVKLISEEELSTMLQRRGDSLDSHKIIAKRIADGKRPLDLWEGEGGIEHARQSTANMEEDAERQRKNEEKWAEESRQRRLQDDREADEILRKREIERKKTNEQYLAQLQVDLINNKNREKAYQYEQNRQRTEYEQMVLRDNNKKFGLTGVAIHVERFGPDCIQTQGYTCTITGFATEVSASVRNNLKQDIKDIDIACKYLSQSGTDLTPANYRKNKTTIFEKWKPGEIRNFKFKIRAVEQAKEIKCTILKWN